jgi:hypothetical protein
MRNWVQCCTFLFVGLLALPALAQPPGDPGKDGDPPPRREHNPELKQKLLELFDHNKDGTLDRNELMELRMTIREEFAPQGPDGRGPDGRGGPRGEGRFSGPGDRGPGDRGPEARGPEDRGPDGPPPGGRDRFADRGRGWRHDGEARGPDGPDGPMHDGPPPRDGEGRFSGPGPGGPGGPGRDGEARDGHGPDGPDGRRGPDGHAGPDGRPPRPRFSAERLFKRFDADHDGKLSMVEFGQLTEFVREHLPMGPPPGPDGRRFGRGGRDGRDGPPPRGRDGRDGPPQGADDRPPPGPDGPAGPDGAPPRAADEDKPGIDQSSANDMPSDDELSLEDAI